MAPRPRREGAGHVRAEASRSRARAVRLGRRPSASCIRDSCRPGTAASGADTRRAGRRARERGDHLARAGRRGARDRGRHRRARLVAVAKARTMTSMAARLRSIPSVQFTLAAALLGVGFLIAAQLAAQGPRVRYTTQERAPLIETATQLQQRQDQLKARILQLREQIQSNEQTSEGSAEQVRQLNDQLQEACIAAGLIPLTGTGIVLQLQDSQEPVAPGADQADYLVGARDLRSVVEELWAAGGEAIANNRARINAATAVIDVGPSILVNAASLAGPSQVSAIGPDDLYARLSASPGFVDLIRTRAQAHGIGVSLG